MPYRRTHKSLVTRTLAITLCCLSSTSVFAQFTPGFTITTLQDSGFNDSLVHDINNAGFCVGSSVAGSGFDAVARPVFWDNNGNLTLLENATFTDDETQTVRAINDNNNMVGRIVSKGEVLWVNQVATAIPFAAQAYDINNSDQIAGVSARLVNGRRATIWNNLNPELLGGEPTGFSSEALAINSAGDAAGALIDGFNRLAAFWSNNQISLLGNLPAYENTATATDINDSGRIIGRSSSVDASRAVIWENNLIADLGTLGGATSRTFSINNFSQIVGNADTASGESHLFLWQDGVMYDLAPAICADTSNCYIRTATINDLGQIAYTFSTGIFSTNLAYTLDIADGALASLPSVNAPLNFVTPVGAQPPTDVPIPNEEADVRIRIRANVSSVFKGDILRYQLTVSNEGPTLAKNITITDKLPKNVRLVPEQSTLDFCTVNSSTITCQYDQIGVGSFIVVNLTVQHKRGRRITNTVSVKSTTSDPLPDNNSATLKTNVFR